MQNPNLWINKINIGNVMNLNPTTSDELSQREDIDVITSMETMLENCILYIISAFCVATEMRFLWQQ